MVEIRLTQLVALSLEDRDIVQRVTQHSTSIVAGSGTYAPPLRLTAQSVGIAAGYHLNVPPFRVTNQTVRLIVTTTNDLDLRLTMLTTSTLLKYDTPAVDWITSALQALVTITPNSGTDRTRASTIAALVAAHVPTTPVRIHTYSSVLVVFQEIVPLNDSQVQALLPNYAEPDNRHSQLQALLPNYAEPNNVHTQVAVLVAIWPGAIRLSQQKFLLSVRRPMLTQCLTTVAFMITITRKDGVIKRFTTLNKDLVWEGNTYRSCNSFDSTAIESSDNFSVDNLEIAGIIDSADIDEVDLVVGRYDHARVEIFLVDWLTLAPQRHVLRTGYIGEVRQGRSQFFAEIRGLFQRAQTPWSKKYSPTCRATLYDAECKVVKSTFTRTGTVTTVTNNRIFNISSSEAEGWFKDGSIKFTSGLNTGLEFEIKRYTAAGSEIELWERTPFNIAATDAYEAYAGCDKKLQTCIDKFDNIENMRAEPYAPGYDVLFQYPDAKN